VLTKVILLGEEFAVEVLLLDSRTLVTLHAHNEKCDVDHVPGLLSIHNAILGEARVAPGMKPTWTQEEDTSSSPNQQPKRSPAKTMEPMAVMFEQEGDGAAGSCELLTFTNREAGGSD